jgi:hypothetical protein
MMLFDLTRLVVPRQRRVFRALDAAQADKSFVKSLNGDTRAALEAAVKAGAPLDGAPEVSPLVIDTTTDSVLSAFEDLLRAIERIAVDRVVRPTSEVVEQKNDAMTVRELAFPKGAKVILDLNMADQLRTMNTMVEVLTTDKKAAACIKRLGLEWVVSQVVAHLEPYARAVRSADGRALSTDSDAFRAALTRLALKVTAHHEDDAEIEKRLLGPYRVELEAQQQDERDARKRNAEKKKAEELPK